MKGMQSIKRGSGFAGVLAYALEEIEGIPRGKVIGGNMSGDNQQSLAKEFGISRRLRPDVERPVWHNSLRLPKGEKISDELFVKIADDYMQRMGFSDLHQRVYILHDDEDGQHIHIIADRIALDGTLYLGKNENLKSTKIIQRLEKVYGLTITKGPDYEDGKIVMPDQKRPSDGELGQFERTGDQPPRYKLIELIDKALEDKPTAVQFVERLHAAGVTVKPNLGKEKLNGFSFELDGVPFKGSQLGNNYKGQALFQRGLTYEQSRDYEALKRLTSAAANDSIDPTVAVGPVDTGRSQDPVDDRAAEPVSRAVTGADQDIIKTSPDALRERDPEIDRASEASIRVDDAGVHDSAASAAGGDASRADRAGDHADLPINHTNDTGHRVSYEVDEEAGGRSRISERSSDIGVIHTAGLDAANQPESFTYEVPGDLPNVDRHSESVGDGVGSPSSDLNIFEAAVKARADSSLSFARALFEKMKVRAAEVMQKASSYYRDLLIDLNAYRLPVKGDRNEKAVRNMLNGLSCRDFEVRIVDSSKKLKAQARHYSAEQLAEPKTLAFLRSKNAQGLDIYVRPKDPDKSGLVLVDDLNRGQIAELEVAGLKPAVLMQTSDQNFQAWIRINRGGFDREEHAGITRFINEQIGGDPASTDQEHFGRLVGFTNRKPKRIGDTGLPPYVRLESHDGRQAINGQWLLDEVRKSIDEAILSKAKRAEKAATISDAPISIGTLEKGWLIEARNSIEKTMVDKGVALDASTVDFRLAMKISRLGISIDDAIEAFERELPNLQRKSDSGDYIRRTVVKAYAAVEKSNSRHLGKDDAYGYY